MKFIGLLYYHNLIFEIITIYIIIDIILITLLNFLNKVYKSFFFK